MTDTINAETEETPKLFISYSWTNEEHISWVIALATELRANGIDVILDKWRLKEGYDAYAFMEQIVTDPKVTKVAVICDEVYVNKSKERRGGVGAESQIMSSELYGKVNQDKFVAIARHKDKNGRVFLPIFMNQRIFIDFTSDQSYHASLEQLIRWCFDKPFYVEPELGTRPAFLENSSATIVREQTIFESNARSKENSNIPAFATSDFFRSIANVDAIPGFDEANGQPLYNSLFEGMLGTAPLIRRILNVFSKSIEKGESPERSISDMHAYLEFLIGRYGKGPTEWSDDLVKFFTHFIFVSSTAILIEENRFDDLNVFLSMPFVVDDFSGMTAKSFSLTHIHQSMRSLEARNQALSLNRLSLHADLIKQVSEAADFSFRNFVQADLFLYLREYFIGSRWWPTSLVYVSDTVGALPWYVRAVSALYRTPFLNAMGVTSKEQITLLMDRIEKNEIRTPEWRGAWGKPDIVELANLQKIVDSWK